MTDQVIDRREAIEAAFTAAEAETTAQTTTSAPETTTVAEDTSKTTAAEGKTTTVADETTEKPAGETQTTEKPAGETQTTEKPAGETQETFSVEKPPQSWRPAQKAKWDKLDPDIRQEIVRRERETTRVLGESASARQLMTAFHQAVQPFQARLSQIGAHPIQAMQQLLKADHFLSSNTPAPQKAAYMAKLIKGYGVDLQALDAALAGQSQQEADPVASRVEQLLQQRLAPLQNFIQQQAQREKLAQAQQEQQALTTVAQMEADTVKYPHFAAVREDMADLVDIAAKRGVYLSLEQAYTRATAMNPEISKLITEQQAADAAKRAAQTANARAQRALNASSSVSGAPSSGSSASPGNDRRSQIAAALDSVGGR